MGDFDLGAGIKLFSLHRFCMIVQCSAAVIRDCKLCWLLTALSAPNVLGARVPVCLFLSRQCFLIQFSSGQHIYIYLLFFSCSFFMFQLFCTFSVHIYIFVPCSDLKSCRFVFTFPGLICLENIFPIYSEFNFLATDCNQG